MHDLTDMMWAESRKAIRSRMPLWTALGASFMPLGIAFLIFVSKNPEISRKLGLIGAKADLMAYAATDWPAYLELFGLLVAAGGYILFVLVISWVFGREFVDGTLKDLLAIPVPRSTILLAKFLVALVWFAMLSVVIFVFGLVMGAALKLPGGGTSLILCDGATVMITACLTAIVVLPFAFFASAGRGYLLPVGVAILTLMMTNLVMIIGRGEFFPWAIPGMYAMGEESLPPISYAIVLLTCAAGMLGTYLWWKYADQNR